MVKGQLFQSKVFKVDAIQWIGENPTAVREFTGVHKIENYGEHFIFINHDVYNTAEFFIAATNTWTPIKIGDWIVKDPSGPFYLMSGVDFDAKYELSII